MDQLIWGSRNLDVQKSLISRDKLLTLAAAIETARSHEVTSKHMKTLAGSSESHQEDRSVDAIHKEQEKEQEKEFYRKMQITSQILCLLAKHIQRNRKPCDLMLCLPKVPNFPTKGAHDTNRDPFKTVANIECRLAVCSTVVNLHSCRLLLQIPIRQETS